MLLRDEKHIEICKEAEYVSVLNGHGKINKGFLQLEMDKWGLLKSCTDAQQIESVGKVNYEQDWSKIEYELVEETDGDKEETE